MMDLRLFSETKLRTKFDTILKELDITYFNKSAVNKSLKKEIKAIDKAYKTMDE